MNHENLISIFTWIFWIAAAIVFYSYAGYGILMVMVVFLKKKIMNPQRRYYSFEELPTLSLVVAAYNEEDYIEEKIQNSLELRYPADKLELVFITDGSNDRTPEIVTKYPQIRLLHQPERRGKVAAMNRAKPLLTSDILVFCDANTLLNKECLVEIAKHYADPRVGGVAGEKKVVAMGSSTAAAVGEGAYWKYESFLKKLDSDLHSTMGAAGELFSVRRTLFETAPEGTIIEDFVQSLKLCLNGYILRYEPNAYACEGPSASIKEEMKRKVRICAGAFQAMVLLKDLFNVFKYPVLSFQFISHRILRWTICPILLLMVLISNIVLVSLGGGLFYSIILALQVLFYAMAILGWVLASREIKVKTLYIPFYFLFMNYAVILGFRRYIQNKQTVLWEKAERQKK